MTTSISNQISLTSENAERILSENGFENQNLAVHYLSKKKVGYGHFELSVDMYVQGNYHNTICLKTVTTDTMLIDDWNEDEPMHYETQEEVMNAAFSYIMRSEHNQEKLNEFLNPEPENE